MWRTHVLGGISALWILEMTPGITNTANVGVLAAVAAFGALLPDLDATSSKIRSLGVAGIQPFNPLGAALNGALGHRGVLHSPKALVFLAGCAALLSLWAGPVPATALWLGYASHLALDACTKSGIPNWGTRQTLPGWTASPTERPLPSRRTGRIYLVPPICRVVTGSAGEDAYFMILAASAVALLLTHIFAHCNLLIRNHLSI